MDYQYKIIVSNRKIYKEFEIPSDLGRARIGTVSSCEFRLNPNWFFYDIEMDLEQGKDGWSLSCTDSVYISRGDMRKLFSTNLVHGDVLQVCYISTGDLAFEIRFMIDFDEKVQKYDAKIALEHFDRILVGNTGECTLRLKSDLGNQIFDRCEIQLVKMGDVIKAERIEYRYGLVCNGMQVTEEDSMHDCSFLSIADISIYYREHCFWFDSDKVEVKGRNVILCEQSTNMLTYPLFNRNTRVKTVLDDNPIEILDPPEKPKKPKTNIILALLPSIVMLALVIVVRGFMSENGGGSFIILSVVSMSMGIITSAAGIITERKTYKQETQERIEKYEAYIARKREEIAYYRNIELQKRNETYIDLAEGCRLVRNFDGRLFERTPQDADFLNVFLGRGRVEAVKKVNYKVQEKLEVSDELFLVPEQVCNESKYIENAPVTADFFNSNAVGIIGNDSAQYDIFKNSVLDLAIRHYYTDVQMFVFLGEEAQERYQWIRLLPHLHLQNNAGRNIVCDNDSKNHIFDLLFKELTRREESKNGLFPYLIIFVKEEMGIKSHPISRFIPIASSINVTFVFFEESRELLPLYCNQIIELNANGKGFIINSCNKEAKAEFAYTSISNVEAEAVVNKLAPVRCEEISLESALRKSITLFELLNIYSVYDLDLKKRWASTQIYKSMAAPLGVNAKNDVIYLDLHEKAHGPHGLVAGTTGSGKSEILQTYILSMATLFHPYEVGFVIIDFKGGGMVNQFKDLPHLVGAITNIDGKEINRSLKSIKAELLKRQTLFAQAEVNHIDKYIKLYKDGKVSVALPHLIIIVDEFAELKAEQPEFMKELISAARIGRSLGVHLILATQKPAGQVNEQIWSNSKFKLCLKVQTKEDSNEVLKTPVAAEIREPGRAYLQVGNNEMFELLQSGFSGAPAQSEAADVKEFKINQVDFSGYKRVIFSQKKQKADKKALTQLETLVNYIHEDCEKNMIKKLPDICLPALPKVIPYPEYEVVEKNIGMSVPIGIYDNPDSQYQGMTYLDASGSNSIIIGSSQYGKTNLLQTIIRGLVNTYSPKELNLYILDFGAMLLKNFETLKHVGGVVCASEDEKFKNLFKLLNTEILRRKDILMKAGVSSFSSYKEAGYEDLAQICLIVDNYTAVKELYLLDEDCLLPICRDGLSVGISVIVANAQTTGIGYKYMSNFSKRVALYCNDSNEYSSVLEKCRMAPDNTVGRGMIEIDKVIYEFQTYLSFEGEREIDRVNHMRKFTQEINDKYRGYPNAKHIPEVPALLEEQLFKDMFDISREDTYKVPVGIEYDSITPMYVNLLKQTVLGICGKEKSGKSNLLRVILNQLNNNMFSTPSKVFLLDDIEGNLREFQQLGIVDEYSIDSSDYAEFVSDAYSELKERQQTLTEEGPSALSDMPLLLFIVQNKDAIADLSKNSDAMKKYKEILAQYKNLKVAFIYANLDDAAIAYNAPEVLKLLKESKNIFYFNNLQNIKIFDVSAATVRKYKKEISLGDAYYLDGNEVCKIKTVKYE